MQSALKSNCRKVYLLSLVLRCFVKCRPYCVWKIFVDYYRYGANFKIEIPRIKRRLIKCLLNLVLNGFLWYLIDFIFMNKNVALVIATWFTLSTFVVWLYFIYANKFCAIYSSFFILVNLTMLYNWINNFFLFFSFRFIDCGQTKRPQVDCYIGHNGCFKVRIILWKCTNVHNTRPNVPSRRDVQQEYGWRLRRFGG